MVRLKLGLPQLFCRKDDDDEIFLRVLGERLDEQRALSCRNEWIGGGLGIIERLTGQSSAATMQTMEIILIIERVLGKTRPGFASSTTTF